MFILSSSMRYRFSLDGGTPEELNPENNESDDQRSRPRTGPIEKIADIAFDALRKHEIEPDKDDAQNTSR